MAIPDFQTLMRPLLAALVDGRERSIHQLRDQLAEEFRLTEAERAEMLPSGRQARFDNRVHWSASHLAQAALVERPSRARVRITARGSEALGLAPSRIDMGFLERYPEFQAFRQRGRKGGSRKTTTPPPVIDPSAGDTPQESIETGYALLRSALVGQIREKLTTCSPKFFEQLVLDVLVAMGYGGSRQDAAQAVGRSGDGGIDGIIKEDRLGLDVVYVQAKRWAGPVPEPQVREFAGSLDPHRARKGVFITASTFTIGARAYVDKIEKRIVLIDGAELAELMIDHGVGVANVETYVVKRVDADYFEES
ncbi:MAG: Mrr restriction system protein [uncultured Thermomicrobiales bacterium]|uniref:Mrr restriction system protein n=1 Tax=uncultured Thermomicrobiales bacterium TaxID=1645740 RepID=A0A6J4UIV0_9BACT|nr:MAG: Mrr restriction system protein [uncultured Thermomicrobiales bacterium]